MLCSSLAILRSDAKASGMISGDRRVGGKNETKSKSKSFLNLQRFRPKYPYLTHACKLNLNVFIQGHQGSCVLHPPAPTTTKQGLKWPMAEGYAPWKWNIDYVSHLCCGICHSCLWLLNAGRHFPLMSPTGFSSTATWTGTNAALMSF